MMNHIRPVAGFSKELDGLRGVAILVVMVFHAGMDVLSGGFFGVDIFFVLSGFLITSLLIREFDKSGRIRLGNFYFKRFLRLIPALLILLITFVLVSYLALSEEAAGRSYIEALAALAFFSNWSRAFSMYPSHFLGHTWSLAIEGQFYLLWPLLLVFLLHVSRRRWPILAVAAIIALGSALMRIYLLKEGAPPMRLFNGLDTRLDALLLGCFVGALVASGSLEGNARFALKKALYVLAPMSVICLAALLCLGNWRVQWVYQYGFVLAELSAAALILEVLTNREGLLGRLAGAKWLVWVGSISYGLYLWHYPIYLAMFAMKFNMPSVITLGSLLALVAATLSYYVVEKPLSRYKRRFGGSTVGLPVGKRGIGDSRAPVD